MAIPTTIDTSVPAGGTSPGLGDNEIVALKNALLDLFGLGASPTTITAALFSTTTGGLITVSQTPFTVKRLVGTQGTITDNAPIIDLTTTLNDASETFTVIKLDVTDTASAAATKLFDLLVGGVSKASLTKAGNLTIAGSLTAGSIVVTHAIKTADQTLTQSNTTLQNVTDLSKAVAASTNYLVEVFLLLNAANVTSDFKFGWTVPAGCTMLWGPLRTSDSASYWMGTEPATDPIALLTEGSTFSAGSFSGTTGLFLNAIVRNSINAGTLQLQASQNLSDASDNKILKDSLMRVTLLQ